MSKGTDRLSKALRTRQARTLEQAGRLIQLAEVVSNDPLRIKLMDSGGVLEDDQTTLTQWMEQYVRLNGLDPKDTVMVTRKADAGEITWAIFDVFADKSAIASNVEGSGPVRYNPTSNKLEYRTDTAWVAVPTGHESQRPG